MSRCLNHGQVSSAASSLGVRNGEGSPTGIFDVSSGLFFLLNPCTLVSLSLALLPLFIPLEMVKCAQCPSRGIIKLPSTGLPSCLPCFYSAFESRIHQTIIQEHLFKPHDKVAIGASGGKDSTVLAYVLQKLNQEKSYGLDLHLLSIDEGITGYRDDSLRTVQSNALTYNLPLTILSYATLYQGWTMDAIVKQIGLKNNCTFCGVFRRQALERGAKMLGCNVIATGHNADDLAETVILNFLRGDYPRLTRCTAAITEEDTEEAGSCSGKAGPLTWEIVRVKPFKFTHQKEIVMYAYFKRLEYFSTECKYAPEAYRGNVRELLKQLEGVNPQVVLNIVKSGDRIARFASNTASSADSEVVQNYRKGECTRCSFITSNPDGLCKACLLLEGLSTGQPMLGIIGRKRAARHKVDD